MPESLLDRVAHELDDSEGSVFCTCGAGPFPSFKASPLPAFRRHVEEASS